MRLMGFSISMHTYIPLLQLKKMSCLGLGIATMSHLLLLLLLVMASSSPPSSNGVSSIDWSSALLMTVDQSGKGDFTKIQDAIDAVPSNNSSPIFIWITPGVYREKIVVPIDKPFITLSGRNARSTIITWSESWSRSESVTASILASDFVGRCLTFQNTYGTRGQAVALSVSGDRVAFYGCSFLSFQDTLLDDTGRHYYNNCYIEGGTDFICGNGLSLFENCHLHSMSTNGGSITAQRRSAERENTGFSFVGCKITGVGVKTAILGRPWGAYSRVVFGLTYMSSAVIPCGWDDWGHPSNQRTVFYGQYHCFGIGSDVSERVSWSLQLSAVEASSYVTKTMIDGQDWLRPLPTHFRRIHPS